AGDPGDPGDPGDAGPHAACCFDGKLELPQLLAGPLDDGLLARLAAGELVRERLLVGWDFAARLAGGHASGTAVPCVGAGGCGAVLWNTPTDAVTGHRWDGSEQDHRLAPEQYAALHFHADDLDDCRWEPTVEVRLPAHLPSGAYAVRLDGGAGRTDRVPFFVRPAQPAAPVLFLVPTASYLAYANDHPVADGSFSEATAGQVPVLYEPDLLLHEHREWGLSCYDAHRDGSGVGISSARRPMLNMRPTHRYHVGSWQLASDLAVMDWLRAEGIPHDVATDADLHREGRALLAPYRCVVTGTHPEYHSTAMLDAVEAYVDGGGRLAYLGANGFYWRVAFDAERPWVMELRRGQAGSRAWESAPGECHLAFTGERGGLWRHLGRPPQRLTGVGYAAQGFDRSGWYRRLPDAGDPRAAFVFEGVEGDVFGTAGTVGGGAVGQEVDRGDRALGTPVDALVLATSEGLDEGYRRCVEELPFTLPGTSALEDPDVRADVVYHVKPGGGAVFAVGSIAWGGALAVDPDVARITGNVLRRFADPEPLPW
ncbi:MAG: N,N-dimethylformamidase beta subunit family domain-containing protein, partial [Acidimicrobiales bacterium]